MSRRPARETIAFAVVLAAVAAFGGVAAATAASAQPATADLSQPTTAVDDRDAAAPNATFDYDGDRLNVDPASGQPIAGSSTLDAGEQVTVRIRSSNSEHPFLSQSVTEISEGGDFATTFDFSDVDRGVEFTVSVRYNGTELASAPAVVGDCDPSCGDAGGDATFSNNVHQTSAGDTVAISVNLDGRQTATLDVGSDETDVHLPITVTDGDGDGEVVVMLDTGVDGPNEDGVSAADDADSVRVHDDADRPTTFDPDDYKLALYASDDLDGEKTDIGVLAVADSTEDPATTRTTNAGTADGSGTTTTAGTIYDSATTNVPDDSNGLSIGTLGVLGAGGVLAVLGIVALVGGLD